MGGRNTLTFEQGWSISHEFCRHIYYSAAQRAEIWDRWQRGESMSSIGRPFLVAHTIAAGKFKGRKPDVPFD